MASRRVRSTVLAIAVLAGGCTFVPLEPAAEGVRVIGESEAAACQRLGTTHVSVLDRVGIIDRSADKVAAELDVLARNSAAGRGGDAVLRDGAVEEGRRSYVIYQCGSQ